MINVTGSIELTTSVSEVGRLMWKKATSTDVAPTPPSTASSQALSSAGWVTSDSTVATQEQPYLWGIELISYSDGSNRLGSVRVLTMYKQETGRVVWKKLTATQTSPDTPGINDDFSDWTSWEGAAPNQTFPYMWGFDRIKFSDGSILHTPVRLLTKAGVDANLLDWVKNWDGKKTQIGGNYVIAGGIYAGAPVDANGLTTGTGVAMGDKVVSMGGDVDSNGNKVNRSGIYAFNGGLCVCAIDPEHNLLHIIGRFANGNVDINGNINGKCCIMDDNKLQFFNASKELVNELIADNITPESLFGDSFSFTLDSASGSEVIGEKKGDKIYKIAYYNTARTGTFSVSINGKFQTDISGLSSSIPAVVTTKVILRSYSSAVDVSSATISTPYISEKTMGYAAIYTASPSSTALIQNPSAVISNGSTPCKYKIFYVVSIDNSVGTTWAGSTMTVKWGNGTSISNANVSITTDVEVYRSTYGANGVVLGKSARNNFAAYLSGKNMLAQALCNGYGYKIEAGRGLTPYYGGGAAPMPVCLFAGRLKLSWSTNTASSPTWESGSKGLGDAMPTLSLSTDSDSGGVTLTWPAAWASYLGALDVNKIHIQATPYSRNSGGNTYFDTAICVRSVSSSGCTIHTSNDLKYSASAFYIRVEYIL